MRMKLTACGLLLAVTVAGCGGARTKCNDPDTKPATSTQTKCVSERTGSALSFEVIAEDKLPSELGAWKTMTQGEKKMRGGWLVHRRIGDYLYMAIIGGEQPSGGYRVEVEQVNLVAETGTDVVSVKAKVVGPPPGSGTTAVITYPRAYVRIPYAASKPAPAVDGVLELTGAAADNARAAAKYDVVVEDALPPQLAQWPKSTVQIPGGTSEVVGGYLYVMASAGMRGTGGYSIKISGLEVMEDVVLVEAHLGVPAPGQNVTEALTYPKAYARVPFAGSKAPRVELKLVEDAPPSAAKPEQPSTKPEVAAKGEVKFQAVDPKVLPKDLQGWALGTRGEAGISGQVAESALYLQVYAGEQPTGGYRVEIRKVELLDGTVRVQAVLHKPAPGAMVTQALTYPKGFAKIEYAGTDVPKLQVEWVQ